MPQRPIFNKVRYWVEHYGSGSGEDIRAAHDFVECETDESVNSLRAELVSIMEGNFDVPILDQIVGKKRAVKHNSYPDWARLMLQWIANYKR